MESVRVQKQVDRIGNLYKINLPAKISQSACSILIFDGWRHNMAKANAPFFVFKKVWLEEDLGNGYHKPMYRETLFESDNCYLYWWCIELATLNKYLIPDISHNWVLYDHT